MSSKNADLLNNLLGMTVNKNLTKPGGRRPYVLPRNTNKAYAGTFGSQARFNSQENLTSLT